jgi:ubiquinone/menaquinone biosynthesis C-methylase UbiE
LSLDERSAGGRKTAVARHFDGLARSIDRWRSRNRYYHHDQIAHLRYLIGARSRVLVLGCGTGDLLNALEPRVGVGVDLSAAVIEVAREKYPHLQFVVGDADRIEDVLPEETFDYIVLPDMVGYLDDVQRCLDSLHRHCHAGTRLVLAYHNFLWQPVLRLGESIGLKMPTPALSWLSMRDLCSILHLSDFEVVKTDRRLLLPKYVPLLSWLINNLATLPGINAACLSQFVVARSLRVKTPPAQSISIVIPCRNERGNIEEAIARMPAFGTSQEIIFVDGHSSDGTCEEIERVAKAYPQHAIRTLHQHGTGKGDAVRQGFAAATGDVLMILDADLTVPPEDLPRFHEAIASGKAEFVNGCRLIYPMEDQAMRLLNLLGNKFFAWAFSWLIGQPLKDTLCGTKVLRRSDYEALAANRAYFGDFDPFGDFDLLFGASKLSLRILEVPVRYRARRYGETKIHRFQHGWLLLRMVVFAFRKMRAL